MSEVDKVILLQLTGKALVIFSHTVHNFFFIAAILSISQFDASVSEGDGMAEVCVSIDRPIVSDVTFTITPTDESALGKLVHTSCCFSPSILELGWPAHMV